MSGHGVEGGAVGGHGPGRVAAGARRLRRLPGLAVLALVLAAWLVAGPGESAGAARVVAAAAAASAGVLLVRRARGPAAGEPAAAAQPDEFEVVWRRGAAPARLPDPPERVRLQRLVRLAVSDADHAHRRLRPVLRDLADARFESAHGTHLERDPRAPERVDAAAWAWVRPDRPEPVDRRSRGPSLGELEAAVAGIERIGGDGA